MPTGEIIVLTGIVTVFVVFGLILGGLSWYCRSSRVEAARREHRKPDQATAGRSFAWDD
jgi:hypothetical protein